MSYAILVLTPEADDLVDWLTQRADSAPPKRIFFYRDGVYNCTGKADKQWLRWCELNLEACELVCCSGSMQRRELTLPSDSAFSIGGLGLLAECYLECDEVIQFG